MTHKESVVGFVGKNLPLLWKFFVNAGSSVGPLSTMTFRDAHTQLITIDSKQSTHRDSPDARYSDVRTSITATSVSLVHTKIGSSRNLRKGSTESV